MFNYFLICYFVFGVLQMYYSKYIGFLSNNNVKLGRFERVYDYSGSPSDRVILVWLSILYPIFAFIVAPVIYYLVYKPIKPVYVRLKTKITSLVAKRIEKRKNSQNNEPK